MTDHTDHCLNCNRTSEQVPLLRLKYTGHELSICPQCLPILIHKPEKLVAVSGEWTKNPAAHDH